MEKEIRSRETKEIPVGRKYKPTHRSNLTSSDIESIVQAYNTESKTQLEVA